MNKRYILLFVIFLLFFGGLKFDFFQKRVLFFTNFIKEKYHSITDNIENIIFEHLNQQETIQRLSLENRNLQKYKLQFENIKDELKSLQESCETNIKFYQDIKLIRAISYAKLGDFSSVWLDFDDFNSSKIYGLVKDDYAAGIVISKKGNPLALLVNNKKCAFAVEVGDTRAPGIATGKKDGYMQVKYIPMYKQIKAGDEVVTSGMDRIFFYGIKVGKVLEVKERGSYKVAIVKPYVDISHPKYFWIILDSE